MFFLHKIKAILKGNININTNEKKIMTFINKIPNDFSIYHKNLKSSNKEKIGEIKTSCDFQFPAIKITIDNKTICILPYTRNTKSKIYASWSDKHGNLNHLSIVIFNSNGKLEDQISSKENISLAFINLLEKKLTNFENFHKKEIKNQNLTKLMNIFNFDKIIYNYLQNIKN